MKSSNTESTPVFATATSVSDSSAWFISLARQIRAILKDHLNPNRVPITAAPIEMKEIWSRRENHIPGLLSLLVHVSVITAFITLSVVHYMQPKGAADHIVLIKPFTVSLPHSSNAGGGGGGGKKAPTLPSKGVLPRASDRQFVPRTPIIINMAPELIAVPTIVQPVITNIARIRNLIPLGDPHGVEGPPSSGPGSDGGIGNGKGPGVGDQIGPGGPGCCGGPGDGDLAIIRAGAPGVTNPVCTVQVEPNYSDDARKARIQGVVLLAVTIQKDGSVETNQVLQGLGYGLDDEAKKVLNKWKCNPGRYNGQAVAVPIQIKINFHLY